MAAEADAKNQSGEAAVGLPIGRWLVIQAGVAAALALAMAPLGVVAVYSSVLGSVAAMVPAVFFAAYVGRKIGRQSMEFLQAAVVGEAVKLLLTAVLCGLVFLVVEPIVGGAFFIGMIGVLVAGWFGLAQGLNSGV